MEIPDEPAVRLDINFEIARRSNSAVIPQKLTPKLAYFVGLLRDGNINKSGRGHKIRIYQKNSEFLENTVNKLGKKLFDKNMKIMPSEEDFVWQLDSKPLYQFFTKIFEYPESNTQKYWNTPKVILQSHKEIQRWYIAGFVDAEGSICVEEGKLVIYIYQSWHTKNECPPLKDIKEMLKQFGIHAIGPYLYIKSVNAFRLKIKGIHNVNLFFKEIHCINKFALISLKEPETKQIQSVAARKFIRVATSVLKNGPGSSFQW